MQLNNEDNGWHERGELPPAGVYCEYQGGQGTWHNGTIAAHVCESGTLVAIIQGANCWTYSSTPGRFRPIKSERERAIESAAEIIRNEQGARAINSRDCPHKASAVALANAGLLRLPESDR